MISCKVDFSRLYDGGSVAKLYCSGTGVFPVFSGLPPFTNRMGCARHENAPLPTGKYWIVDRPKGGLKSWAEQEIKSAWTHNDYDKWFALYRQDGLIDDHTYLDDGSMRSNFRLHPLRPDGTGHSDGCITFYHQADFDLLRAHLLRTHTTLLPVINLKTYGEVEVLGDMNAPCIVL